MARRGTPGWAQRLEDFSAVQNVAECFATFMNGLILDYMELLIGHEAPPAYVAILPDLRDLVLRLVASALDEFERRANERYAALVGANAQVWS